MTAEKQLRVEGRMVHHDREFDGAVEIDVATGLITHVGPGRRAQRP